VWCNVKFISLGFVQCFGLKYSRQTKTDLTRRGHHHSAFAIWNSVPKTVLVSPSLTVFRPRLKTFSGLVALTLPLPAPLKVWPL